jgi:hypothetical protein
MTDNTLDELMDRLMDPEFDLSKLAPTDVDGLIQYYRNKRADAEAGVKPTKEKGPKISLDSVMKALKPKAAPAAVVKRRF